MGQIDLVKKQLKPHIGNMDVDNFIKTEMVLVLMESFSNFADSRKAFLLLHNYSLIGKLNHMKETAFLQRARLVLRQCSSKQRWKKLLEEYRRVPENIRLFKFIEEDDILKSACNGNIEVVTNRRAVYIDHIKNYSYTSKTNYADKGEYTFYLESNEPKNVHVNIPHHEPAISLSTEPKLSRESIKISINDLISSAKEMNETDHNDYCYQAIQTNVVKEVVNNKVITAEMIDIHNVVNMVGMVGSGKSTLMKVLSYHLAKRGKKIVIVLDTVSDTLQMYRYFRKFGILTSPLIGSGERTKYISQISRPGEKFLDSEYSEYLTGSCILAGMSDTQGESPLWGKEPCRKLSSKNKTYNCPFIDTCPAKKMYRDVLTSNIIVTTAQGLAAVRNPVDNRLFIEYVLEQADLVIFDECDNVQHILDEFFAPATDFDNFTKDMASHCAEYMELGAAKIDVEDENAKYYNDLCMTSTPKARRLREMIQSINDNWKYTLRETFSSMTLYKKLVSDSNDTKSPKLKLSPKALTILETVMGEVDDDTFEDILTYAKDPDDADIFEKRLTKWLSNNDCDTDPKLISHIKLYILFSQFDQYIQSLDAAYSFLPEDYKNEMELFNFLQSHFASQQKLLPSSPMGNLMGMKNDRRKGLQLYKQYAFGRALMTKMPWLKLTDDGKPLGPHILLLSGSSWADGCLEYHVNVPVKYILDFHVNDSWKREKLSNTAIFDLNTGIFVSGSVPEDRIENIKKIIGKIKDNINAELRSDDKILMIVNSYNEAKATAEHINKQFKDEPCAYMVSNDDEDNADSKHNIRRGDVAAFDKHSARILLAPAKAIERGYNIVNEKGHSSFGSVFFLVRPMAVPDEISAKCAKLNGLVEREFIRDSKLYTLNGYLKADKIRAYASKQWHIMEEQARKTLSNLDDTRRTDITAGLFVLILQIFGRLARITDANRRAPRVYFADGAFHTSPKNLDGYDVLYEIKSYLETLMNDPSCCEIANTLYGPFYEAFRKGVLKYAYEDTDISDGYDTADDFTD